MTTEKLKIVVCDDERAAASDWCSAIEGLLGDGADICAPTPTEINASLGVLAAKRRALRETGEEPEGESVFDGADIVFLDYDLVGVHEDSYITGQELAYLVRCYSPCGTIVVMNEGDLSSPTFELRLETSVNHFADLRISSEHIGNPGLWRHAFIGYRPWAWPVLPNEAAAFVARTKLVEEHLDKPVLGTLGLSDISSWLSQRAVEALVSSAKPDLLDITFRDVVAADTDLGIRPRDVLAKSQVARVAAARVTQWLRGLVLPAQDPLIDAPHLVSRFASLIEHAEDISRWSRAASLGADLEALGLNGTPVAESMIDLRPWTDRALWSWTSVRENADIPEVNDPWGQPIPPFVFVEDLSRFVEEDAAQAFASQVSSMHDIRFVIAPRRPQAQDLINGDRKRAESEQVEWSACDPNAVSYAPANLLAE